MSKEELIKILKDHNLCVPAHADTIFQSDDWSIYSRDALFDILKLYNLTEE